MPPVASTTRSRRKDHAARRSRRDQPGDGVVVHQQPSCLHAFQNGDGGRPAHRGDERADQLTASGITRRMDDAAT